MVSEMRKRWVSWKGERALAFMVMLVSLLAAASVVTDRAAFAAQETPERFELQEIVVTATREQDPIERIPRNVTVITAYDIEQAPSNNMADLLAREANITVRSITGHDKRAVVDIRGMGDTAVSNVLVLVDGVRWNAPDLSGPDFSSIPLEQIERIEILRGPGTVLYGDGAVGGVIQIITKKGEGGAAGLVHGSVGSYGTRNLKASYGGTFDRLKLHLNSGYYTSHGYRDNGYLRKADGGVRAEYAVAKFLSFSLSVSRHEDRYGLPGPVSKRDMDSERDRKASDSPYDFGETRDDRYTSGARAELGRFGSLEARVSYRHRHNPFLIGYTPLLAKDDQMDQIDENTTTADLDYRLEVRRGGRTHKLHWGSNWAWTDYIREERAFERKAGDLTRAGYFFSGQWSLTSDLTLTTGYRRDRSRVTFRRDRYTNFFSPIPPFNLLYSAWVTREKTRHTWDHSALDLGLTWKAGKDTTLFGNFSTSFRNPNVDELAQADEDLKPQKGRHVDAGIRRRFSDLLEGSVTFFHMRVEDEIYYGRNPADGTSVNRNYDETTLRRGVETEIKCYPAETLYVWANYSYTRARFEHRNTRVPLVPRHKGSLGLEWRPMEPLLLSLTGTWVGSRVDGNDEFNNLYRELDDYSVVDAKVSFNVRSWKLFAGVNNLLDEVYSTTGYSETYYPMPGRNYYAGVEWKF